MDWPPFFLVLFTDQPMAKPFARRIIGNAENLVSGNYSCKFTKRITGLQNVGHWIWSTVSNDTHMIARALSGINTYAATVHLIITYIVIWSDNAGGTLLNLCSI